MPSPESTTISFDPVAAFLRRPLHEVVGTTSSQLATACNPVPRTLATLHNLATEYAWASVLDLATSLLATEDEAVNYDNTLKPHEQMICSMYRTLALLQTRQVERASTAIEAMGDLSDSNNDYRYETYPEEYEGRNGSFVPFELRMLAIETRVRHGDFGAINDAYKLKHSLCQNKTPQSQEHLAVLLSALSSYHLRMQQGDAAVDIAKELVQLCDGTEVRYIYGTVLLHVGDLEGAEEAFHKADAIGGEGMLSKQHTHRAMLLSARGKYTEAIIEFDEAGLHNSTNQRLAAVIANNVAICLLHVGRLAEAIDRLESVIRKGPSTALDEGLVFNLATLYDLAHPDSANEKKHVLQSLCMKFGREGFNLDKL